MLRRRGSAVGELVSFGLLLLLAIVAPYLFGLLVHPLNLCCGLHPAGPFLSLYICSPLPPFFQRVESLC